MVWEWILSLKQWKFLISLVDGTHFEMTLVNIVLPFTQNF